MLARLVSLPAVRGPFKNHGTAPATCLLARSLPCLPASCTRKSHAGVGSHASRIITQRHIQHTQHTQHTPGKHIASVNGRFRPKLRAPVGKADGQDGVTSKLRLSLLSLLSCSYERLSSGLRDINVLADTPVSLTASVNNGYGAHWHRGSYALRRLLNITLLCSSSS